MPLRRLTPPIQGSSTPVVSPAFSSTLERTLLCLSVAGREDLKCRGVEMREFDEIPYNNNQPLAVQSISECCHHCREEAPRKQPVLSAEPSAVVVA